MYVPEFYRPRRPEWARQAIRENPLALLVSRGPDGLLATHLPVVPAPGTPATGSGDTGLVGMRLLGHLNRANPHWEALPVADESMLVFQGAGGYLSPAVYGGDPDVAPTWNFVSVHVHGDLEPIMDRAGGLAVVKETVRVLEGDHGRGWDMTRSLAYFDRLVAGVGAFRFTVTAAEAMFKLSQEKEEPVRDEVAATFDEGPAPRRAIADAMRRWAAVR